MITHSLAKKVLLISPKTEYDKLIKNIGEADFKAIMSKLTELENQTTTIITNLGEIGQNVLDLEQFKTTQEATNANQLMTNEQQKTKNEDFEKRILALENRGKINGE